MSSRWYTAGPGASLEQAIPSKGQGEIVRPGATSMKKLAVSEPKDRALVAKEICAKELDS